MPTFLISAIFWQVMFCAVTWTLEKQCKKESWCHMCFGKKVVMIEGHVTKRSSRKAWELASGWGGGLEIQKTLCSTGIFSVCAGNSVFSFHTWEGSASRGGRAVHKAQGGVFPDQVVPRLANKRPSSLLWFLFLQPMVSNPLPGIVKVLPE